MPMAVTVCPFFGGATITVTGDIIGGNSVGVYGYGGDGIVAGTGEDELRITVNGDVKGGDVDADPTVDGETSLGGSGIRVESGNVDLTVNRVLTGRRKSFVRQYCRT